MPVVGQLTVLVKYQSQSHSLPLLIVAGDRHSLFGRDWLCHITLDWKTIGLSSIDQPNVQLNSLLQTYDQVFEEGHGEMRHDATTNTPPCELFLKRTIRTILDLIRPDLGSTITERQSAQKTYHDIHSRRQDFFLGQRVLGSQFWRRTYIVDGFQV